jgi:hypothetical protein
MFLEHNILYWKFYYPTSMHIDMGYIHLTLASEVFWIIINCICNVLSMKVE